MITGEECRTVKADTSSVDCSGGSDREGPWLRDW